ncbi:MAG: tetratricopeptide repeat protein [Burkholderiales bacterium]|nr:tetratricopeptide repeat protein [Burkholderiales bacterium]
MKALEKAAKDRVEAHAEPATLPGGPAAAQPAPATMPPSAAPARAELSLEPITAEPAAAPAPRAAAPAARPTTTPPRGGAGATRGEQAQAASVVRAGEAAPAGAIAWLRARPVVVIGILGVLIGIGYGTYVYLQLFHPSLFLPQRPIAPKAPPSPVGAAPAPGSPAPVAAAPAPAAGTGAGAAPGAAPTPGAPLPTSAVVQQAEAPDFAPPPPPAPPRPPEKPAAEPPPPPPPAPRDTIKVSRGSSEASVPPLLAEGYTALQAGRTEEAARAYANLLRAEPRNIDALLGLAALAVNGGRNEEAARHYGQVLELDPRNALAQAGLIALSGRADPLAAESRLKQLIVAEPSAFLYFTLGNLYADQSNWAQAQHAYFQAHHLEPDNADYAYNLAVGLDHVGQPRLALGFYRRAVELAGGKGAARFDLAQARERIGKLAPRVE